MSTNKKQPLPQSAESGFNFDLLAIANGQIAESAGCDFETNQWTFQMPEGFRAGAGKYFIIKLPPNA